MTSDFAGSDGVGDGDGCAAGGGIGVGAGLVRRPDCAKADPPKISMRINTAINYLLSLRSLFRPGTGRSMQRRNLLTYDWILRSFVDIDLGPMSVVFWHISIGKNCFDGTFGNTRIAIDASVGVDVKTIGQLMKCFNRTNGCAVGVLAIDA